jgi:molybdopterin synthase catalytic subunit
VTMTITGATTTSEHLIRVQTEDFDICHEYKQLSLDGQANGAYLLFIGTMRDFNLGDAVSSLVLEYYPGMTEKSLLQLANQVQSEFDVNRICILHRVGEFHAGDQIVLVGVAGVHRNECYLASQAIMTALKGRISFWKKEVLSQDQSERWLLNPEDEQSGSSNSL